MHYFPYDVKLQLLAHSQSFLANQKARNAIVGAENLLNLNVGAVFFKLGTRNVHHSQKKDNNTQCATAMTTLLAPVSFCQKPTVCIPICNPLMWDRVF